MPTVTVNRNRIFFTAGAEPGPHTLLCIHGSGGDHRHWPESLRSLPKFRVVALDLPGHGRSQGGGYQRVADYADFIEDFVTRLGLRSVIALGHSLGGAVVQALALRRPAWLKALVLAGTGARLRVTPEILATLLSDYENAVDRICAWSYGPAASQELIRRGRTGWLQTPKEVTFGDYFACHNFDVMEQVSQIDYPTLVVSGGFDRLTPPKYGDYLARHIYGATHRILEECGHMMAVEKPDVFVSVVRAFLKDLE